SLGRAAAAGALVAVLPGPFHETRDPLEVLTVDERRHRRLVVAGIAEDVLVREPVKEVEERPGDRLLGEDEQWALAAELAGEGDDVLRGRDADVPRRLGRAGERDPADARVGDERR